jgi:biotin operon repressor
MEFSDYRDEITEDIKSCLEGLQVQPILFMGAGISQRYIGAPGWEGLLKYLSVSCPLIKRPYGYFSQAYNDDKPAIASEFSGYYADWAWEDENGHFPDELLNEKYQKSIYLKYEICSYLSGLSESVNFDLSQHREEIEKLKRIRPHALITTNYDNTLERIFENYQPVVGQRIVTVNYSTYGDIMKIHGSTDDPESIIITRDDYEDFYRKKKYVSAKLLTYFIEHPLFFFGYSVNDENIKSILADIDEIISPDNELIPNIYLISYSPECESTGLHQKELLIEVGAGKSIRIKVIYACDFGWIYEALSSGAPEISINPRLVRALLARTYTFASQSLVRHELPYDFEMLRSIADDEDGLAKLYGIAELNSGQALNANYPYTITDLAQHLEMQSWNYVQRLIDQLQRETGFNIKQNANRYHVLVKTGRTGGSHKYSSEALELLRSIRAGKRYEFKP